jgi:hypothetical protein
VTLAYRNANGGETLRHPGTIDLTPYFGQIVKDDECPANHIVMPVCTLTRQKYAQPQIVTEEFLLQFVGLAGLPRGSASDPIGLRPRIEKWGQIQFKDDYYGCFVRWHHRKKKQFGLTYVRYCFTWNHESHCTKQHSEQITDEVRAQFSRPDGEFPKWVVNWIGLWDVEKDDSGIQTLD